MTPENDWGAPRIHGELSRLGFSVSEATVSRYMPQRPANPDVVPRWLAFLRNHVEGIAAIDFFTLPTASLRVLYCWFVIHHQHRRVLHFNATFNPSDAQQSSKNLLLSGKALVNSTPQPVILADHVECKHGSMTGQLDPEALFHLRSRGIGEQEARSLLTYSW
jgi:hypothetical protein